MKLLDIGENITTESIDLEALQSRLYDLEAAQKRAREITKNIKYADMHMDIIRELEDLAETVGLKLDDYNVRQVYQAKNNLESAIYELEEAFEDAIRDAQNAVDDAEYDMEEGRIEDTFGTKTIDKHDRPEKKKKKSNESLKALARHVKEGVPLPDSLFRYQSEAYFDTFRQAKQLREAGALPELDWESEEMLGTDIGESVQLKGIGPVWLDVPYLDESDGEVSDEELLGMMKFLHSEYVMKPGPNNINAYGLPVLLRQHYPEIDKRRSAEIFKMFIDQFDEDIHEAKGDIRKALAIMGVAGSLMMGGGMALDKMSAKHTPLGKELAIAAQQGDQVAAYHLKKLDLYADAGDARTLVNLRIAYIEDSDREDVKAYLAKKAGINEAEYNGKKVQLNKPKRGGSKKYYVYVKNPKTGRVKKISFGDVTGLKTKSGNKKRAKSFAARHNCEKKNDKMKAGYWACRLPRYGLVKGGQWW